MAIKRSEQINPENAGYYHLISRCVRRAFLCGKDPDSGQNYDNRRQWIEDRILELANYFDDMRIYFGSRDIGMAEQFLHGSNGVASQEQLGRKGVTIGVA